MLAGFILGIPTSQHGSPARAMTREFYPFHPAMGAEREQNSRCVGGDTRSGPAGLDHMAPGRAATSDTAPAGSPAHPAQHNDNPATPDTTATASGTRAICASAPSALRTEQPRAPATLARRGRATRKVRWPLRHGSVIARPVASRFANPRAHADGR